MDDIFNITMNTKNLLPHTQIYHETTTEKISDAEASRSLAVQKNSNPSKSFRESQGISNRSLIKDTKINEGDTLSYKDATKGVQTVYKIHDSTTTHYERENVTDSLLISDFKIDNDNIFNGTESSLVIEGDDKIKNNVHLDLKFYLRGSTTESSNNIVPDVALYSQVDENLPENAETDLTSGDDTSGPASTDYQTRNPLNSNVKYSRQSSVLKNPKEYLDKHNLKLKLKEKKLNHIAKKIKSNFQKPVDVSKYQPETITPSLHLVTRTDVYGKKVHRSTESSILDSSQPDLDSTISITDTQNNKNNDQSIKSALDIKMSKVPQSLSRVFPEIRDRRPMFESTSTKGHISPKKYTTSRSAVKRTTGTEFYPPVENSSSTVCANDPCGIGVACHPEGTKFLCFCSDGTEVDPGQPCPDIRPVNVTPPAVSMPHANEVLTRPSQGFLMGSVLTMAIFLLSLLSLMYFRRKKICTLLKQRKTLNLNKNASDNDIKISTLHTYNFASNPNYYAAPPDQLPLQSLSVQLISKDEISFLGELGEGCFGRVYKGEYDPKSETFDYDEESVDLDTECSSSSVAAESDCEPSKEECEKSRKKKKKKKTVAVKVLKELVGMEAEASFMREVEIMASFRHPNILSLIGIVVQDGGGTPWMVFEFMPYGDLAEVLRSCSKQYTQNNGQMKILSKMELLNICIQVASGMEYLSQQHFVHRDLACRNCLVGKNLKVKISDFGMSRDVYTCDYYKVGGSRMLPVRWMAPESILYGKFTLESDVWSFGVVLWEIYSFGKQPYYGNSNEEVVQLILQGILLSPSESCPPEVREVMRLCWSTEAHNRLTFPEIVERLKRAHETLEDERICEELFQHLNYSQLCMREAPLKMETDIDQYLLPKTSITKDEYLTVLSGV